MNIELDPFSPGFAETALFRLTYRIPPTSPGGRRWVISDIHGCIRSFKGLINKIELNKRDHLFLLGDYINKGPDSAAVIDYIISLKKDGFKIFAIRGNHEENLLELEGHKKRLNQFVQLQHSQNLINKSGKIKKRFLHFLHMLPYYFDLGDVIIVHAGLNFKKKDPFKDLDAMLNIRDFNIDANYLGNKFIVHGHNPKSIDVILSAISQRNQVIPLDNGCVYHGERPGQGNLLCLNLDDFSLIIQENIEQLQKN